MASTVTDWLAIDSVGNVAVFTALDEAPIPAQCEPGFEFPSIIREFFQPPLSPAVQQEVDKLLKEKKPRGKSLTKLEEDGIDELEHCLLLLQSETNVESFKQSEGFLRLPTNEPVVYVDLVTPAQLGKLLKAGTVSQFTYLSESFSFHIDLHRD